MMFGSRPRGVSFPTASFALALSIGCAADSARNVEQWEAETETIGDTTIVRTVSGSEWGSAELVLDLSIGVLEGAEHEMFGSLTGIAAGPDGDVYVYDSQGPALRRFGPDGSYRGTLGRPGQGPGEYSQSDGGLAVLTDGRVVLRDPGNGRFVIYGTDNEYLESMPGPQRLFTSAPLFTDAADGLMTTYSSPTGTSFVRHDASGTAADTIAIPRPPFTSETIEASSPDGGAMMRWPVPFSPRSIWTMDGRGKFLTAITDRYEINLHRADGTVLRIARIAAPARVTDAERAAEETRVTTAMRGLDPSWRWNGPPLPGTKPFIRELYVGTDERRWIQLHQPGELVQVERDDAAPAPPTFREPILFDLFEPDGRYLGEVRAPSTFRVSPRPVFGADAVWAVFVDEFDVQYIGRFRLVRDSG